MSGRIQEVGKSLDEGDQSIDYYSGLNSKLDEEIGSLVDQT